MDDQGRTEQQLIGALAELRRKNADLEAGRNTLEAALKESTEKFSAVMHATREGICVLQDSLFKFLNRSVANFLEYSENELIGKRFTDFILPDDREIVFRLYSELLTRKKEKLRFTFRVVDKSGRTKWLEGGMSLVSWDGEPGICVSGTDISDRKKAEDALKESEKRYRELVEKANDIIYLADANGHFQLFNSVGMRITGYSEEEIVRQHYLDLVHPEYKKQVERFYGLQFLKRIPDTYYELPMVAKHGETIWIGQNVQLVMEGEKVVGFQAICRDITARKLAEDALIESERTLKSLLAASPVGIIFSRDGKIKWANDAWAAMFRFDNEEEYIGQPTLMLYPSREQYERVRKVLYDDLGPGRVSETDAILIRKDGSTVDVHIRINFLDPDDPAKGTISAISDISDRKRAEEALRKSEERLELCLHGADLGLWDWNLETAQPTWNERAAEMLGYSLDEIAHDFQTWKNLVHSEDWSTLSQAIKDHLNGHIAALETECRFRSKSGEWKWILSQGKVVAHDKDGKPLRMAGTSLDVTERKLAEREKESLRSQLVQSQKMEAIGTLTGGIAHEFNNLLTVVSGYAELLLSESKADDPARSDLQKIVQAARRGADLVRSLLTFSNKSEMSLDPVDLNREVEEVKKLLDRTLPKMIEIELNLSRVLKNIEADSGQVRQVLMNLALNARDAMPEGGKLMIRTENIHHDQYATPPGTKPGDYVQLTVSDTGIGMDNEVLDRIFDPFYTTKGLAYGTGLGLSVVHGILEQHDGYISCDSTPGVGTTFKMYFPVSLRINDSDAVEEAVLPTRGTERILFVDDEEHLRELVSRFLKRSGYQVITAQDCQGAVEVYEKERKNISLVIMDLIMPKIGGKRCLKELLKIEPQVKVLVASGYSDSDNRDELIEAGAKGYVAKPYHMADLLRTVREILNVT
jgi:two-component system, cell cycle sensor histidine kinase and response regulator CckA